MKKNTLFLWNFKVKLLANISTCWRIGLSLRSQHFPNCKQLLSVWGLATAWVGKKFIKFSKLFLSALVFWVRFLRVHFFWKLLTVADKVGSRWQTGLGQEKKFASSWGIHLWNVCKVRIGFVRPKSKPEEPFLFMVLPAGGENITIALGLENARAQETFLQNLGSSFGASRKSDAFHRNHKSDLAGWRELWAFPLRQTRLEY